MMFLCGWGIRSGLGHYNRDLAEKLGAVWIVPRHWESVSLLESTAEMIHVSRDIRNWPADIFRQMDRLIIVETEYVTGLVRVAKSFGAKVICVAMYEHLHLDRAWTNYVDQWLAPTQQCYDYLRHRNKSVRRVPACVDVNRFLFRKREIAEVFLFVNGRGGMANRKGLRVILEMARRLPHESFIVMSQVPIREQIPDHVKVMRETFSNVNLYDVGDICIQPSRFEGLGLQFLECQAAGMPLITTDGPPMNQYNAIALIQADQREVDLHGRKIIAFDARVDHLVEIVKGVSGKNIALESIAARKYVEDNASWDVCLDGIKNKIL